MHRRQSLKSFPKVSFLQVGSNSSFPNAMSSRSKSIQLPEVSPSTVLYTQILDQSLQRVDLNIQITQTSVALSKTIIFYNLLCYLTFGQKYKIIIMSDLSFLIQNQNEVQIDQSFLQKCRQTNSPLAKEKPSILCRAISSQDLNLKSNRNLILTKKKASSPLSFNINSRESDTSINENLVKLSSRVQALEQNQKRMEKKIGIQFFQLNEEIQKRNNQQKDQFQDIRRMKNNLHQNKRTIAQILTLISKKK